MNGPTLKPCPHCGEEPEESGNNLVGIVLECMNPNCPERPVIGAKNRATAYPAWNNQKVVID